jgi:hypothetical protein
MQCIYCNAIKLGSGPGIYGGNFLDYLVLASLLLPFSGKTWEGERGVYPRYKPRR